MARLTLTDGCQWRITPKDKGAARIIRQLTSAMNLESDGMGGLPIEIRTDGQKTGFALHGPTIHLNSSEEPDLLATQLSRLSMFFSFQSTLRGGLLVHGGCVEIRGKGLILAGAGGTGKTTAINRLPAHWKPLSDDQTLIAHTGPGQYRAHPWPTWSRFMGEKTGGTWDVQRGIPLTNLFFLARCPQDAVTLLVPPDSAGALDKSSEQVCAGILWEMEKSERIKFRRRRFKNCCELAKAIPCYRLDISPDGPFWKEIEKVIDIGGEDRDDNTSI